MKSANIRDKFIISIVDNNGIKQFSIHRLIKKILIYSIVIIGISSVSIFFMIKLLAGELKYMYSYKDAAIEKYINVYNKNENLKQQIEISQEKLDEINQKMLDLEDIISMKDSNAEAPLNKFDLQTLSNMQRETLLQILPNSIPFQDGADSPKTFLKSGMIFNIAANTPIYATADGIVDVTRNEYTNGIGKFVKIVHSFGFTSVYGYLSKVVVKRGDIIRKGQVIGYSGNSNSVDSLYYDVRFLGSEVDVKNFIDWNLDQFEVVMNEDSIIDWDSLLWTFDDIMQINNHKIFIQYDNALGLNNIWSYNGSK